MNTKPKLIQVLEGQVVAPPPVWMMRQAGRHLPEYLELRARAKNFLDFCYTPSMAAEATLQPVRRYGMDAAILFADILLILDTMGLSVRFEKGVGPIVQQIDTAADLAKVTPQKAADRLSPVLPDHPGRSGSTLSKVAARQTSRSPGDGHMASQTNWRTCWISSAKQQRTIWPRRWKPARMH